ncbi:Catechol-2,3-dioxygenase [Solibacillus isronensis B3W22]|uniref:Catechol-2,3-dioxygenase n=1 Tax=Solibacillus isronensis B3W22 TaxID=1224748 RepID=K1KLB1_9BACL|nr:VOC family protein [Solibacillus isronensis]AMO86892.1 glyoxalase [Solibacillus silvestris]EKB44950.1 Catechol-2,3-dioxygenase [Solibacillus isronensis B3W22]
MATHFHKKPNLYPAHVQLKVSDLVRSIEYYTTVIGFKVLQQTETEAYLTADGQTSLVSLVEVQNAQPLKQGFAGLYHLALLLPSRKDLGNIVQHFVNLNVRIGAADHDVSEALYLNDPDGNGIEIYIDRHESEWTWNQDEQVHMVTEQLNFQPILAAADGNWNGLPADTVMGHVHLSVVNLDKSEQFYTNVLDYNVVTRYGAQALFVSTGKYHHHFGLNTWNSNNGHAPTNDMVGLKSFTVVLKNAQYAEEVKQSLTTNGFIVENFAEAPAHGGTQLFSTVDPNGLRIVFTLDGE